MLEKNRTLFVTEILNLKTQEFGFLMGKRICR